MTFRLHLHLLSIGILLLLLRGNLSAQPVTGRGKTMIISVRSQPESVAVYVDSTLQGFTPCHFEVPCQKPVSLRFTKEGFLPRSFDFHPTECSDSLLFVRLYRPAVLAISSEPESAVVQVAGKFAGRTPLVLTDLSPDTLQIVISKRFRGNWSTRFVPTEGSRTELMAKLSMVPAILNVFVNRPDVSIFLDDRLISQGSAVDLETGAGAHKIGVRQESAGRSTEMLINALPGNMITLRGEIGKHSLFRGVLAFLVPGSPQLLDGSYLKGSLMLVGSLALGVNATITNNDYRDRVSQYDRALESYVKAPTEVEALRRHDDVEARKSEMDSYYTRRTVSFALFAAVYVYSVVDALMNHLEVDNLEVIPFSELRSDVGFQLRVRL